VVIKRKLSPFPVILPWSSRSQSPYGCIHESSELNIDVGNTEVCRIDTSKSYKAIQYHAQQRTKEGDNMNSQSYQAYHVTHVTFYTTKYRYRPKTPDYRMSSYCR